MRQTSYAFEAWRQKVATKPGTTNPDMPNTMAQPPDDFSDLVPDHMVDAQQNMYGNTENELQRTSPMPVDGDQTPVVAKVASFRSSVNRRYGQALHRKVKEASVPVEAQDVLGAFFNQAAERQKFKIKEAGCKIPVQYRSKLDANKKPEKKATIIKDAGIQEMIKRSNIMGAFRGQEGAQRMRRSMNPMSVFKSVGVGNSKGPAQSQKERGRMFQARLGVAGGNGANSPNMFGKAGMLSSPTVEQVGNVQQSVSQVAQPGVPDPGAEQRAQDVHEQQLQFAEDKHNLELTRMQMEMEQQQQQFALQQEHAQAQGMQKMEDMAMKQQQGAQQAQAKSDEQMKSKEDQQQQQQGMQQAQQQQQAAQQGMQHRANLMKQSNVRYNEWGEPVMPQSPIPATLLGAGLGGAAGHFVAPTKETSKLREMVEAVKPEGMTHVKYEDGLKRKFNFKGNADQVKRFYKDRSLRSNSKRLMAAIGIGSLAGYGMNRFMDQSTSE